MRQVRIRGSKKFSCRFFTVKNLDYATFSDTCAIPNAFKGMFKDCTAFSHITEEENRNFAVGWQELNVGENSPPEYTYQSASHLNNTATTGVVDIYR